MTWEPDYATVAELKGELRIEDTLDDAQLARWVTTASRTVDTFCHRQFGQIATVETRTYSTTYDRHLGCYVAEIDDVQDTDDLIVVNGSAQAITDYELGPTNAAQKGKPFERIYTTTAGPLVIDALWGWTSVPAAVKQATILQAARLAARRDSPYGIAGSPSTGSELRLLARVDPDVEIALGKKYRREWWAA